MYSRRWESIVRERYIAFVQYIYGPVNPITIYIHTVLRETQGWPLLYAMTNDARWLHSCCKSPSTTQLGSGMSLDVFLSFRKCPKHPNTPLFDFGRTHRPHDTSSSAPSQCLCSHLRLAGLAHTRTRTRLPAATPPFMPSAASAHTSMSLHATSTNPSLASSLRSKLECPSL